MNFCASTAENGSRGLTRNDDPGPGRLGGWGNFVSSRSDEKLSTEKRRMVKKEKLLLLIFKNWSRQTRPPQLLLKTCGKTSGQTTMWFPSTLAVALRGIISTLNTIQRKTRVLEIFMVHFVVALSLCALAEASTHTVSLEYVFKAGIKAEVLSTATGTKLLLPLELKSALQKYKGFRLPTANDYKMDWLDYYSALKAPFIAFGDFNHDGQIDIVSYLIGNRDDVWMLVAFHRHGDRFEPFVLYPAEIPPKVSTKYRVEYNAVQKNGVSVKEKCECNLPCIDAYVFESASSDFVWRDGKYVRIGVSD